MTDRLDNARDWLQAGAVVAPVWIHYTSGPLLDGNVPKWYAVTITALLLAPFIRLDRVTLCVGAFIALAALSLAWSPDPAGGAAQLWKMAAVAAIGLAARASEKTLIAVAVSVAAAWVIPFGNSYPAGGFGNPNFEAEWLIAAVPLCAALVFRGKLRWLGIAALAIIAVRLLLNPSKIELFVAWLAVVYMLFPGRWRVLGIGALLAMVLAVIAWHDEMGIAESIQSRAQLLAGTAFMFADHPVFGAGLGGFDYLYPAYQDGYRLLWEAPQFLVVPFYPAAAHNDWLNLVAAFGVVGAVAAGAVLWQIENWRSCWAKSLLCLAAAALIGFPLQTPATAVLAAVCIGSALPRAVPLSSPWRLPWRSNGARSRATSH